MASECGPKCAVAETLDELRARCAMLREMGVAHHDPSTGAVAFFPPQRIAPALDAAELEKLADARNETREELASRMRYGAAGGMRPGAVSPSEVAARTKEEREEQARIARQNQRAREARAKLDAKVSQ